MDNMDKNNIPKIINNDSIPDHIKSIPLDYNYLKNNLDTIITDDMRAFIADKLGRDALGKMSEEAWLDFIIGANIMGISMGLARM